MISFLKNKFLGESLIKNIKINFNLLKFPDYK